MENKIIKVKIESQYGTERIYPLTFALELNALTGQKTLSRKHIETLKQLGFTFEVMQNEI
jgi:hypothetical protein